MAAQGQQSQNQPDQGYGMLWALVAIFIALGMLWYFAHDQIVGFVLTLKLYELKLLSFLDPKYQEMHAALSAISPTSYRNIDMKALLAICVQVGKPISYGAAVILGGLAVMLYLSHATLRYKKVYSTDSLAKQEVVDWPQIKPVLGLDLVKEPIDKGPWAMGLTPMQFAKKYKLLQEHAPSTDVMPGMKMPITVSVLRGAAYQVFANQLGPMWRGIAHLPIHTKALFAIFTSRVAGDREGAAKLLAQIADSAKVNPKEPEKIDLNFSGVDELLAKHKDNKKVMQIMRDHAFVLTTMASLLVLARQDGVLASADFLWLKLVDRRLWYMLNTMGRKTPFAEVAGPFAHWQAELQLGRPIRIPMVEEAVNGLELAIKDVIYTPDQKEE